MRRNLTASIQASSHVLLDFDSWISKLKLPSWVMASLTHSEGCCMSSESFVASSVRTKFIFNLWVSFALKRKLFVSYTSQKRTVKASYTIIILHCPNTSNRNIIIIEHQCKIELWAERYKRALWAIEWSSSVVSIQSLTCTSSNYRYSL